jgi:hypothetical protein
LDRIVFGESVSILSAVRVKVVRYWSNSRGSSPLFF